MKAQLLPHKYQTAGLVAAGSVIIAMIALGAAGINAPVIKAAGRVLLAVALAVAVLSKEKHEDEMITDIRLRSIAVTGLIFLLEFIIFAIGEAIAPGSEWFGGYFEHRATADILDMTMIYIILFKAQIISGRSNLNEE